MPFERVERGRGRDLVCLPGWAFDASVFQGLDPPFDEVRPAGLVGPWTPAELADFLRRRGRGPAVILGWSLGGYLALDLAAMAPDLVAGLVLVSLRAHYPPAEVERVTRELSADPEAALGRFERRCLAPGARCAARLPRDLSRLLEGLRYLAGRRADLAERDGILAYLHGTRDLVAPVAERPRLPEGVPARLVPGAGHLPFLGGEGRAALRRALAEAAGVLSDPPPPGAGPP
ncbi:alpha/beta fold hydrolase [Dissulfurirhabdus thermomarina]|uniref:alpha/beta fold hydrolase n=1 Tax=Dissulfurirhabdus thermomarina TaxID=1765737 RepID=UPI0014701201|nr:alpha/beta fold hydrolase [Dissulfurirhabdus thermomarina]NMX22690.1 alpha/beta fold hydrolase [Dissulfurirhabdus thermomarina]